MDDTNNQTPTEPPQATTEPVQDPQPAPAATAPAAEPTEQATESTGGLLDQAVAPDQADPQPEGAPESYGAFTDAEGREYSSEELGDFTAAAKELGLSQEKAQKMFGVLLPQAQKYQMARLDGYSKQWEAAARTDPEFGGEHLQQNLAVAKQAYNAFASDGLKEILKGSRLSNNPEVIRLFYRIGTKMQQDRGVAGSASAPAPKRVLYPKSNMVEDM